MDELGNPFDLLGYDKNGKNLIAFGIYGIPESILLNEQNIIIKKIYWPLKFKRLQYNFRRNKRMKFKFILVYILIFSFFAQKINVR